MPRLKRKPKRKDEVKTGHIWLLKFGIDWSGEAFGVKNIEDCTEEQIEVLRGIWFGIREDITRQYRKRHGNETWPLAYYVFESPGTLAEGLAEFSRLADCAEKKRFALVDAVLFAAEVEETVEIERADRDAESDARNEGLGDEQIN